MGLIYAHIEGHMSANYFQWIETSNLVMIIVCAGVRCTLSEFQRDHIRYTVNWSSRMLLQMTQLQDACNTINIYSASINIYNTSYKMYALNTYTQ